MPAPGKEEKRHKRAKRAKEEKREWRAIKHARLLLTPLKVMSFNKANANKPADELQAAIAVLQCIVDDVDVDPKKRRPEQKTVKPAQKVRLFKDLIKTILPIFKRARPAQGGRASLSFRNRLIIEAVASCERYGFSPGSNVATRYKGDRKWGCSIVSKAANQLGIHLAAKTILNIWERRTPTD
jgi:hypothetical protein